MISKYIWLKNAGSMDPFCIWLVIALVTCADLNWDNICQVPTLPTFSRITTKKIARLDQSTNGPGDMTGKISNHLSIKHSCPDSKVVKE